MRNKLLLVVGVMLGVLLIAGVVLAQGGLTYSSAYQIQNLSGSTANVAVSYYNQSDGLLAASGSFTITANGSKVVFPFTSGAFGDNAGSLSTFNGSAVVSSDQPIAVILNTQTATGFSPFYGASTDGFSAGSTTVSLPNIVCNNAGFNTFFNVQNAGSADANVLVTYYPGAAGTAGITETATIKPGAAKTFNQQAGSTTKNCNQLKDGSGKFVGSAKVQSLNAQPVVAAVMFLGTGGIKSLQGYDGFTGGSTSINLPLVMSNNSSYYTGIQIQNAGTNPTTATVTFGANSLAGGGTPNPEVFRLSAGQAKTLIQLGGVSIYSPSNDWNAFFGLHGKYSGGATISQSGSEPLVAIVNQNSTVYTPLGTAYEGFDPANASGTVNLPLLAANNSGFYTSMQIQAVSGSPAVTVTYSTNTGGGSLVNPVADTKTLTAGSVWTLIQAGTPGPFTGVNNWSTGGRYIGSAQIKATGGTIIAIVNYNRTGAVTGDTFFTYDGFNAP